MNKFGLIGYPLGHSFSRNFFNEKFQSENIDAEYVNFEIPTIDELTNILLSNPDLCGLNVTIPYKEQVIPFLDEIDDDAKAIGAVNVIKIRRQKGKLKLIGYNSDIIGFTDSIEPLLEYQHKKALRKHGIAKNLIDSEIFLKTVVRLAPRENTVWVVVH